MIFSDHGVVQASKVPVCQVTPERSPRALAHVDRSSFVALGFALLTMPDVDLIIPIRRPLHPKRAAAVGFSNG